MDNTTELFLTIIKTALHQDSPAFQGDIPEDQLTELFHMADIHKVLPLFFEAVYRPDLPALAIWKQHVRQQVIGQTMRTSEFLRLYRHLQAAGIRPLVVKGIVCRSLYPKPDHRPSSDEDLWISEEQFLSGHHALTEFGMRTPASEDALSHSYEIPYRMEGSPLYIELHKHLFPPESLAYGDMNRFFTGAHERAIAIQLYGHTIYTLSHTDHLFYLICHAFKHFLHSGFGIRQVCDIILYANEYGNHIDWKEILDHCQEIRADKFAASLFQIGSRYLGFDPCKAAYPPMWKNIQVDELPMLEDLLQAGLYGSSSMSRQHSSGITLEAVAAQKQNKKGKISVISTLFPSASKLRSGYPYLKKHPYLLPVAWCCRLWKYGAESRQQQDNTPTDALKIGRERLELMRFYDILE